MTRARKIFSLASAASFVLGAGQALAEGMLPGSNGKEPYTVEAQKLDYFDKEQKLIYTGDVIATQGQTKVKGTVMTILLDKTGTGDDSQQDVRHIEMRGPVTVLQKDKIGTGDSATYDKGEDKWYLIGNVTLSQGEDVTRGDRVVYDLKTSQAKVESAPRASNKQGRVVSVFMPKDKDKDKDAKNNPKPAPH